MTVAMEQIIEDFCISILFTVNGWLATEMLYWECFLVINFRDFMCGLFFLVEKDNFLVCNN